MAEARIHLNNLPDEILVEILLGFRSDRVETPEELARLREVSSQVDALISNPLYWKNKTGIHFYNVYKRHLKDKDVNWLNIFKEEYKKQYGHLTTSQRKRIVCAIKEDNLEAIRQLNPTFNDLHSGVNDGQDTPIALCTKNRNILRHLYYTVILPAYRTNNWANWTDRLRKKRTILFWAIVCQADINHIDHLLKLNIANINEVYFDTEESPLHIAAQFGRTDVIAFLITKYGFRIDKTNNIGETALHAAARHGKLGVIRYLIAAGIDLDVAAPCTALCEAAKHGHHKAVSLLLAKGANATMPLMESQSLAIHFAAQHGRLLCVKALIEHNKNSLNALNNRSMTPLYFAARDGHDDIVAYLLEQGADITIATNAAAVDNKEKNKTAIMRAVDNKHWNIVLMLLAAGSDFNALIEYFFLTDNHEALAKLIELKPERFDQAHKNVLLLKAATTGKPQIMACLLTHQADATQKDSEGYLPIHWAAILGHHECIKKLIEHDVSQIDAVYQHAASSVDEKTPLLFFAQEAGDIASVDFLLSKMSDKQLFDALLYALQNKTLSLVEKIIVLKPALLYRRDAQNKTPLMIANDLDYKEAIDVCFKKNEFEEAYPGVFLDMESHQKMNDRIVELDKSLKSTYYVQDVKLMIDTQEILSTLNSATTPVDTKLAALDTYKNTHHTISAAKDALCTAALIAIVLGVIVACYFASVAIASFISASFAIGWLFGIGVGASAVGLGTEIALFSTNNFFTRTFEQHIVESRAESMADCGAEAIKLKQRG